MYPRRRCRGKSDHMASSSLCGHHRGRSRINCAQRHRRCPVPAAVAGAVQMAGRHHLTPGGNRLNHPRAVVDVPQYCGAAHQSTRGLLHSLHCCCGWVLEPQHLGTHIASNKEDIPSRHTKMPENTRKTITAIHSKMFWGAGGGGGLGGGGASGIGGGGLGSAGSGGE